MKGLERQAEGSGVGLWAALNLGSGSYKVSSIHVPPRKMHSQSQPWPHEGEEEVVSERRVLFRWEKGDRTSRWRQLSEQRLRSSRVRPCLGGDQREGQQRRGRKKG